MQQSLKYTLFEIKNLQNSDFITSTKISGLEIIAGYTVLGTLKTKHIKAI